jgi:NAD(P)-dependent dehydrogenase (short-subunit alcohol dehydrogenase family)
MLLYLIKVKLILKSEPCTVIKNTKYLLNILFFLCFFSCNIVVANDLGKKTVFITGGVNGIGGAIAKEFADDGWVVWVSAREKKKSLANNIRIVELDLKNQASVKKVISEIYKTTGRLDVVINNSGYGLLGAVESLSVDQIKDEFEVNLYGAVRVIQEALPIMRKQNGGHIINISSTSGIRAVPGLGAYAASKKALEAFSESIAAEVSVWNIKVSVIQPGTVNNSWISNCAFGEKDVDSKYGVLRDQLKKTLLERSFNGQKQPEIGKLVLDVAKNNDPDFRYQTNQQGVDIANEVYKERSGNAMKAKMIEFAHKLFTTES